MTSTEDLQWPRPGYAAESKIHPIAILNTSILTADGSYTLSTITLAEARSLIADREIISAVGHQSTADILTTLLGRDIPVNRIEFTQEREQAAIVFKLRGRPPEGVILSAEQVEAIGYDLKILDRY
jgi:Domain of unknown function (DUF1874)